MIRALFILSILTYLGEASLINVSSATYDGTCSATRNGEKWSALVYIDSISIHKSPAPPYYIFRADVYSPGGLWVESMTIRNLKLSYMRQHITSTDRFDRIGAVSADYFTLDGDGYVADKYELDTRNGDSYLQLTHFDESTEEVTGVFQLGFSLSESRRDGRPTLKNIQIANGTFKATLKREWFE